MALPDEQDCPVTSPCPGLRPTNPSRQKTQQRPSHSPELAAGPASPPHGPPEQNPTHPSQGATPHQAHLEATPAPRPARPGWTEPPAGEPATLLELAELADTTRSVQPTTPDPPVELHPRGATARTSPRADAGAAASRRTSLSSPARA